MFAFLKLKSDHPRYTQLRALGLFALLSPGELRVVDGLLHERTYLAGEIVFDEGEEGQALYVVLRGRVLICRQGAPEDGRIAEIPTGAMFGELALLDGAPRTAQARALDECVLAALSRADFDRLVDTHAGIASRIALQLARDLGQKLVATHLAPAARPL